jgi:hypothetical protein
MNPDDSPPAPAWFPDVLRPAVPSPLSPIAAALLAAPSLAPFWEALAAHVLELRQKELDHLDAAAVLLGCVLTPLALGYDAHGTLARKVRGGVNMQRRRKAASLALELVRRLAVGLIEDPDFTTTPGLASQKPSWRGFIREVKANLTDVGFHLRERDAVALVEVVCRASGVAPPSRDAVHHALLGQDGAGQ